ncbi:hypothetical protein GCM10009814_20670 [Lapillicoccus jejuensis]
MTFTARHNVVTVKKTAVANAGFRPRHLRPAASAAGRRRVVGRHGRPSGLAAQGAGDVTVAGPPGGVWTAAAAPQRDRDPTSEVVPTPPVVTSISPHNSHCK